MDSTPRVILLGASNLTVGFSAVVDVARGMLGSPLEIMAALGHGRSYGTRSRVCTRELPGTAECGLWDALAARPPAPTYALLTDVGNDIIYGAEPPRIAAWVDQCLEPLSRRGARIVVTGLPIAPIAALTPVRFTVVRTLLFPGRDLDLEEARAAAGALQSLLGGLAERHGAAFAQPDPGWYGLDAIHIRRRWRREAWARLLAPWSPGRHAIARGSLRQWLALRTATPLRWWLAGRPLGRPQPARTLADGTTVALF